MSDTFRILQGEIVKHVTLADLIPELNKFQLLTQSEEEELTNANVTEYNRKLKLTSILRKKPPNTPAVFVQCLRKTPSAGHNLLAQIVENHLASGGSSLQECLSSSASVHQIVERPPGQLPRQEEPLRSSNPVCQSTSSQPSSFQSYPHSPSVVTQTPLSQLPGSGSVQQPQPSAFQSHPVPHFSPVVTQNFSLPQGSVQQHQSSSHSLPHHSPGVKPSSFPHLPGSSGEHQPKPLTSSPFPSTEMLSASSASSAASSAESLSLPFGTPTQEQGGPPLDWVSQKYSGMVGGLSTSLLTRNVPFPRIKEALLEISQSCCLDLSIPGEVCTMPALLQHLRALRVCHEYEVDLLCELLKRLEQHDLHQEVVAYAQSIMQCNVLGYKESHTAQDPAYLLASTVHNCPTLTYGEVCEVKDVFANFLGLDRHTFWLSHTQSGSAILGWGFGRNLARSVRSKLASDPTYKDLLAAHNVVEVRVSPGEGQEKQTVILAPTPRGGPHVSQSQPTTHSVGMEPHEVSPVQPPVPMEVTEQPPIAGAKRKHSTGAAALDVEADRPKTGSTGLQRQQTVPPPTKRLALESHSEGLDGKSPAQFSRQYVTESFKTTGLEGESNHTRALRENQPLIVKYLNLMSILPHLNANSLLTEAENQEMQLPSKTESDKIMSLVTILVKKGEEGFHRFLAALEAASDHPTHKTIAEALTSSLTSPRSRTSPASPTLVQRFASNLKGWYNNRNFFQGATGPYIPDIKFIRLALVTKKGVTEVDKWKDKFLRASLHGHLEDIVKKKKKIDMESIFRYGKDLRKLVLVEGAPGVGKTMLAMKLCQLWAMGEALQEYDLVLFVELRQYQKESALSLEKLLETHLEGDPEMMTKVMQHLVRTGGEKLLIILEGWDELSPALRSPYSWFFELIKAKKLPKASIMVTSRPSVTAPLYDYMDERRIEVLGFDENQQNEYIKQHVKVVAVAQRVRDHLKQFPNLRALAHIPLTLSIICSVAINTDSLPITLTELYDKYVCTFLFHGIQKCGFSSLIGLDSLEEMPPEIQGVFQGLCQLALGGFKKKAFIFERGDLEEHSLPCSEEKFDGYGLLTTRTQSATAGRKPLYQFRHLSIQEFLAGLQISRLPAEERSSLLTKYRSDRQFQNIWKFLSGVSKLQDEAFCQQLILPTRKGSRDQLFLLHCLYEAQNPETCHVAADKMEHTLHLDNTTLNATDCLCAAYMMGKSEGKWEVNLRGCNIGGDGLEVFKWQLKTHDSPNLKIIRLDLTHNQLDASAMNHLAEMFLKLEAKIVCVEIESNKIGDEGVRVLSEALKENNSPVKYLQDCGLTSEAAKWFSEVIKCSKTFNNLYFGFDRLGDKGAEYIASALHHNTVLEELGLGTVGLTGAGLRCIADSLQTNKTLRTIRIDRNKFSACDCHIIAEILLTDNCVERIDLSRNPIGDDGFCIILDALIKKPDALKRLGVFGCEITSRDMHKLVVFFKETAVFEGMNIGLNCIGDAGAEYIAQALRENKSESVKEIYMAKTSLSEKGKQLITETGALRKYLTISYEDNAFLDKGKQRLQAEFWSQ